MFNHVPKSGICFSSTLSQRVYHRCEIYRNRIVGSHRDEQRRKNPWNLGSSCKSLLIFLSKSLVSDENSSNVQISLFQMDNFSAFSSTVLLVKHFPLIFNSTDRQEFFGHFGATRTRNLKRYKNLWNIIVVDFSSPSIASQALMRLHQLEMLRRRLAVEYCPLELAKYAFSDISFVEERRDFEYDRIHGLSPGVNEIHYVLPRDRFSYEYPPIDESILENINEALWSVPAFYTQVLHLMNKMSLPCPMFHSRKIVKRQSFSSFEKRF